MHEYLFDVKLFASVRVKAETPADARKLLNNASAAISFTGCEVVGFDADGDADLVEIDGIFYEGDD